MIEPTDNIASQFKKLLIVTETNNEKKEAQNGDPGKDTNINQDVTSTESQQG